MTAKEDSVDTIGMGGNMNFRSFRRFPMLVYAYFHDTGHRYKTCA